MKKGINISVKMEWNEENKKNENLQKKERTEVQTKMLETRKTKNRKKLIEITNQ